MNAELPEVPPNGCTKMTLGTVYQVFDDNGNCIGQVFKTSDEVEYTDNQGQPLPQDDKRSGFYYPFAMVQPNSLKA